jgi:hypothetical protein
MIKKCMVIILFLVQGYNIYATFQIPDKFIYNGTEYEIITIEFYNKFLNIRSLGINPIWFGTGCYRGYIATYSTNENNMLILNKLYTNNGYIINNEIPNINGINPNEIIPEPLISDPDYLEYYYQYIKEYRELNYENINLLINYTGYIIIGLRTNREIYIKLNFNNGVLINTQNISPRELQNNYKAYDYLW